MVIARMPEDRSKTFENIEQCSKTFKDLQSQMHLCVYTCGAHWFEVLVLVIILREFGQVEFH
eukprot:70192-Heterocapsa_arctica.AAC.1